MNYIDAMKQAVKVLEFHSGCWSACSDCANQAKEAITNLRAAIEVAKKQKPAAWIDEFGNAYPLGAWKPSKATYHDSYKANWKPLFLHPPFTQQVPDCAWELDNTDAFYHTGCDNSFIVNEGTPADNGMVYCPYCSGRITAAPKPEELK